MGKLDKRKVLITSGPTRGLIDRVRFITNHSTGRLGAAIAEAVLNEGAAVTFIRGADSAPPRGVGSLSTLNVITIETASQLADAIDALRDRDFDVIVHAMAVLDYEPESFVEGKVPSDRDEWVIRLRRTPKFISRLRNYWPSAVLVGFKLEVGISEQQLEKEGLQLLKKARCEVVVANDLTRVEANRHRACIIHQNGKTRRWEENKKAIASTLVEVVSDLLAKSA